MGEVTSFRFARAPQRRADTDDFQLKLSETEQVREWLAQGGDARGAAQAYIVTQGLVPPAVRFRTGDGQAASLLDLVRWLETLLMVHSNRVAWPDIGGSVQALENRHRSSVAGAGLCSGRS